MWTEWFGRQIQCLNTSWIIRYLYGIKQRDYGDYKTRGYHAKPQLVVLREYHKPLRSGRAAPRVFILIKDYEIAYWASYEAFKNDIIELNFLDPADREGADIDEIVTDAWNFLALTEEEEDRLAEEREDDY